MVFIYRLGVKKKGSNVLSLDTFYLMCYLLHLSLFELYHHFEFLGLHGPRFTINLYNIVYIFECCVSFVEISIFWSRWHIFICIYRLIWANLFHWASSLIVLRRRIKYCFSQRDIHFLSINYVFCTILIKYPVLNNWKLLLLETQKYVLCRTQFNDVTGRGISA